MSAGYAERLSEYPNKVREEAPGASVVIRSCFLEDTKLIAICLIGYYYNIIKTFSSMVIAFGCKNYTFDLKGYTVFGV